MRLGVVAVHESLHEDEPSRAGGREGLLRRRQGRASTASRRARACRLVVPTSSIRGAWRSGARRRSRRRRSPRAAPHTSRVLSRSRARPRTALHAPRRDSQPRRRPRGPTRPRAARIASLILAVESRPSLMGGARRVARRSARRCVAAAWAVRPTRRRSRPTHRRSRGVSTRRARAPTRSTQPSTCRGVRAPTIAAVTPGCASTQATPSAGSVDTEPVGDDPQAVHERQVSRDGGLLERRCAPAPVAFVELLRAASCRFHRRGCPTRGASSRGSRCRAQTPRAARSGERHGPASTVAAARSRRGERPRSARAVRRRSSTRRSIAPCPRPTSSAIVAHESSIGVPVVQSGQWNLVEVDPLHAEPAQARSHSSRIDSGRRSFPISPSARPSQRRPHFVNTNTSSPTR